MRPPLFALCLVLAAMLFPASALAASETKGGASAPTWAPVLSQAISQWQGAPALGALADLGRLDLSAPGSARQFGLLAECLTDARSGEALTPQAFSALPPERRQEALTAATRAAMSKANKRAEILLREGESSRLPQSALGYAQTAADSLLFNDALYLFPENRARLEGLRALLQARLAQYADRVMAEHLARQRQALAEGRWFSEGDQAGGLPVALEGRAANSNAEQPIARPPQDPLPPFDRAVQETAEGRAVFAALVPRFAKKLQSAADRRDRGDFWDAANEAMDQLALGLRRDGLAFIARHPLGAWGHAKLASYRRQIGEFQDWIASYGILEATPARLDVQGRLFGPLQKAEKRARELQVEEEGRAQRAIEELAAANDRRNGTAARPALDFVDFYRRRISEALKNPDPAHARILREQIQAERWRNVAPLDRGLDLWRQARKDPLNARKLRAKGLAAFLGGSFLALALAEAFYATGHKLGSLAAIVVFAAAMLAIDRYHRLARTFEDLHQEAASLVARLRRFARI